ncbi:MAG: hypothetical protein RL885_09390 [Planctomycetota bacterium]
MEEAKPRLQPAYAKGAIIGGLVGALSMLPGTSCCCCLWWVGGGSLSAWISSRPVYPFGPVEGLKAGLFAGLIAGAIACALLLSQNAFDPAVQEEFWDAWLEQIRDSNDEVFEKNREMFEQLPERAKEIFAAPGFELVVLGGIAVLVGLSGLVGGLITGLWIRGRDRRDREVHDDYDPPREPPVE